MKQLCDKMGRISRAKLSGRSAAESEELRRVRHDADRAEQTQRGSGTIIGWDLSLAEKINALLYDLCETARQRNPGKT